MTTKTVKHTMDKWTCSIGSRGGNVMPGNVFSSPLTVHHKWSEHEDWGIEAAANMRLMGASPDLLEACKAVIDEVNETGTVSADSLDVCHEAIAKANNLAPKETYPVKESPLLKSTLRPIQTGYTTPSDQRPYDDRPESGDGALNQIQPFR